MSTETQARRKSGNVLTIMNQQKSREIKKELQLTCPHCQTIYQLLETQQGNSDQCGDNCGKKWQEILTDYHSKELMADLDKQEEQE